MSEQAVDILIVGGGLTGAALLLALNNSGYRSLLIEAKPFSNSLDEAFDARSLALSPATIRILKMLGVWPLLEAAATPIESIHVSDQHRFAATRLEAEGDEPLGYVVEMQDIHRALNQLLPKEQVLAPAKLLALDADQGRVRVSLPEGEYQIKARMIVAADGSESLVRSLLSLPVTRKDYEQTAIVTNIGLSKPHGYRAFERFTSGGPLALLPMSQQRMSLVWAMSPNEAQRLMAADEPQFIQALQKAFGYRLGRFVKAGQRYSYPLKQMLMPKQINWPVVFVGNAAHTLHPVAGQGFNLGLRDVAMLAQLVRQDGLSEKTLQRYQDLRQGDQDRISRMTDGLIRVFTSSMPFVKFARSLGLIAMDNSSFLKNWLARHARGFGGVLPDLVCEIPLKGGPIEEKGGCDESIL